MAKSMTAFTHQQNALLESPTGTGKSLSLLASALAYQNHIIATTSESVKIYYLSRTHSQLKQVVKEIKKLPYRPQIGILASRKRTCIFDQVRNSKNIDSNCIAERHNCPFSKNNNVIPDEFLHQVYDIEDLVNYCVDNNRCPYLITREIIKQSDLILCPYNYILDPSIMARLHLDIFGSILIIDEAHNIENSCRDSMNVKLSLHQFKEARQEAALATTTNAEEGTWLFNMQPHLQNVNDFLYHLIEWFTTRKQFRENDNEFIPEKDVNTTLGSWHLSSKTWVTISESLKVLLTPDKETGSRMPDKFVLPLQKLYYVLNEMFKNNSSQMRKFHILYKYGKDEKNELMMILCMDPSIVFSPIANMAHSVILASGTLSPLNSFSSELGVDFEIKLSAQHIIDQSQVAAFTIPSYEGVQLTSSYKSLKSNFDKMAKALGTITIKLMRVIPDGVLFFVPSHHFLNELIEKWKSTKVYQKINDIKPIFVEDQSNDSDMLIEKYKESIEYGLGGLMIGVCRGKMSEGIDFADSQARAVLMFGIPYPNYNDINIQLKMNYNDKHSSAFTNNVRQLMNGNEWYDAQAFRSLFQAIGRCIRHKNDYGAIILMDERFQKQLNCFPNWVQKSYNKAQNIDAIVNNLSIFYNHMKTVFPQVLHTALNFRFPLSIVCLGCDADLLNLYKFEQVSFMKIDRKGFMGLMNIEESSNECAFVPKEAVKASTISFDDSYWSPDDEICYKKALCSNCGAEVGVLVFATPLKDMKFCDGFWILTERAAIRQGNSYVKMNELAAAIEEKK
ncbi:Fanconi anemia group J protein [Histomonas meleagridis]|uniref:Fanconi anemia group J protein-like n=1 Tax=Histomonas meleagridis TaxID=135588 RepID=UPI003559B354|nr:Fanconi anemia group J protein [Histomonas meleagridis]KAH0800232.1 Fanconi anemia group J protein-like [Histomonas meleagridis]